MKLGTTLIAAVALSFVAAQNEAWGATGKKPVFSASTKAPKASKAPAAKPGKQPASIKPVVQNRGGIAPARSVSGRPAPAPTANKPAMPSRLPVKAAAVGVAAGAAAVAVSQMGSESGSSLGEAPTWLRTLKATDRTGAMTIAEQSALAVDGQYLLVSSDFVSTAKISSGGNVRFFIDSPFQEAQVIDLDLGAGIVLLKVERPMAPSFNRVQMRMDAPQAGENLVTLNQVKQIKRGTRFVQLQQDGELTRLKLSHEGTGSAWAGFHFDRAGKLVGMTPVAPTTEVAWAPSAVNIFNLLRRQDQRTPAAAGSDLAGSALADSERKRQLASWQEKWTQALLSPAGAQAGQECRGHMVNLTNQELASQVSQITAHDCESGTSPSLGAGYSAGYRMLKGQAVLTARGASGHARADLAKAFASDYFTKLEKTSSVVNLMTVAECQTSNATNGRGQPVHVRFCTSALKNEDGVNDTVISVTRTNSGSQVSFAAAHLRGFSQANTKRVIASLMDKVGEEAAGGAK